MTLYTFILIFLFVMNVNGIIFALTGNSALISPLILLLTILLLGKIKKNKLLRIAFNIPSSWIILFTLYLVFGLLSIFLSEQYNEKILQSIQDIITTSLILIALSGGFYFSIKKYGIDKIILGYTIILFLTVASIILLEILGFNHIFNPSSYYYRQSGFFGNPNDAGQACAYSLLFSLFLLSTSNSTYRKKLLLTGFALMTTYASLLTLSKASMATCSFLWILYLFLTFKSKSTKITIIILLIGVFAIGASGVDYLNLEAKQFNRIEELGQLLSGEINEDTTTERSEVAEYGWSFIERNPFLGIGIGNFKSLPMWGKASHNTYLVLWGESGIFPLLIYLLSIGYFALIGWRYYKKAWLNHSILLLGFSGIMFIYSFATSNLLDNRVFNSSLVIILVVAFIIKEQKIHGINSLNDTENY